GEPRPCGPLPRSARIRPCRHVQSRRGTRPVRGCVPRMLLPGLRIFACVPSPLLLRRCCLDGGEFVGGGPLVSPLEPVRAGVVLGLERGDRRGGGRDGECIGLVRGTLAPRGRGCGGEGLVVVGRCDDAEPAGPLPAETRGWSQYVRASSSDLNAGIGGGAGASGSASTLYVVRLPLVAVSAAVKGLSMWDSATTRIPPTCCPPNLTVGSPARVMRRPVHAAASVPHACAMRRRFVLDGLNGRPGYSARWIETRCSLSRSTSVTVTVRGPAT